ncbi:hypothetical protein BDV33DRAFT_197557 [Aspergillus novoparasiticus]|uniref:Cyanovirin-N domain-containing protein n=1 Tax=Aspergillus novoparasiticus TaxID=986946 RepID=A0A5N6F9K2_9EURO|nr:hypothetical protein BDV33DRAFT_197557 [Aspergillus novoparasiticus]
MQQVLAVLVLYLSALAVGLGLPMPGSKTPSPPPDENRSPSPPQIDPAAAAAAIVSNLHRICGNFAIVASSEDIPRSPSTSPSSAGSPDSPGSSGSRSPAQRMRHADDSPSAFLAADCTNYLGQRHKVNLNLNRCFGWDPDNVRFTVQKNGYGIERGGCIRCSYRLGRQLTDPGSISCTCKTFPHLAPNHHVQLSTGKCPLGDAISFLLTDPAAGIIQYNSGPGRLSCHKAYGNDLGPA